MVSNSSFIVIAVEQDIEVVSKPSATGAISGVMDAASSVFGGLFSTAANLTSRVHSAAWEKAHDDAFQRASQEILPEFVQWSALPNLGMPRKMLEYQARSLQELCT